MTLIETVLAAIESERPDLASWCEDKRHELPDGGKLRALEWICFGLDEGNKKIAARAIGVDLADLYAVGRVIRKVQ